MENALIITSTENSYAHIAGLLRASSLLKISRAQSCGEGRRLLMERNFDCTIIIAPLPDETGENLARQIALSESGQVILAVNSEIYEQVSAVCERDGVITLAKPVNRDLFRQALSMIRTMLARLSSVKSENESLKQKIDTIRIIDRAKNILISSCRMSEHEAHRYIEKRAMDTRSSKYAVSERIIYDYENGTAD